MYRNRSAFQSLVLASGLFASAAALVYVPHYVEFKRTGDNYRASAGYAFIWSPPAADMACRSSFNVYSSTSRCSVRSDLGPAIQTSASFFVFSLGLFAILGMRRPEQGDT